MNDSLNMPISWPKADPDFSQVFLTRYLSVGLLLLLGFLSSGCLVDNDKFDEARLERDRYQSELKIKTEDNSRLNLDITRIYDDCAILSSQLALTAALNMLSTSVNRR